MSAPRIDASGCGSWPTATVQDAKNDAGPSQWERNSDPLNVAVKRWPTPKGSPSGPDFARMNRPESGGDDLVTAVARGTSTRQTWATPRADSNGTRRPGTGGAILAEQAGQMHGRITGSLNPAWTSWLMGWPIGWEDASLALQWECPNESTACEHLATVRCLSAWRRRSRIWLDRLGF
jgi:hypothetical protein